MTPLLSAPTTTLEWRLVAAMLVGFYLVFTYALSSDPVYAIAIGLAGGLGTTVVLAVVVSAWRPPTIGRRALVTVWERPVVSRQSSEQPRPPSSASSPC